VKWGAWRWFGLILTLGGALLSHTSTLLLVGTWVAILTLLLALTKVGPRLAWRVGLVGLGGLSLALILYYGFYVVDFVTQSLPTLLQNLQSKGTLGQEPKLLGTPLLSGFWPQLWAHFRLYPFVLTGLALVLLWPFGKRNLTSENSSNEAAQQANKAIYLIWLAWLLVFLLFAGVDLKVNLLQKHMLFVAPLLCLGTGFSLVLVGQWLTQRVQPSTSTAKLRLLNVVMAVLVLSLILFNCWQGLVEWYGRIYYYMLPPGSG
jgi:hypothetical protein